MQAGECTQVSLNAGLRIIDKGYKAELTSQRVQVYNNGVAQNQSWRAGWDGSNTITGSFFLGSSCAVPGAYPVQSSDGVR